MDASSRLSARGVSALGRGALLGGLALGVLTGCGPELERISELRGLRALAVQKSAPYAAPGEDVEFRMLWEDTSDVGPRPTERFWIGGCTNPPGDLYAGCFSQWAQALRQAGSAEPGAGLPETGAGELGQELFGVGDRFTIQGPPLREEIADPNQPPYGIAFVFFGVCTGTVDWEGWRERVVAGRVSNLAAAFPECLDQAKQPIGPDGYIVGYSSVHSYRGERFRNANPIIGSEAPSQDGAAEPVFEVNGVPVAPDCVGEQCVCPADADDACQTPFGVPDLTECVDGIACIDACPNDGESSCPEIDLRPVLLPALNAEPDTVALEIFGRDVEETLWISYFVDRGSLKSDLRLLNDGVAGWNDDYSTKLYAPREPGPMRIWAVVRDNRGGANWVRVPAFVR